MNDISRLSFLIIAIALATTSAFAQKPTRVTYTDLVKDPQAYSGKQVRIEAVWTYGFEWTYLCSLDCRDVQKAWVALEDDEALCRGTRKRLERLGKNSDNTARVTVVGRLDSAGGYGHLASWPLQFTVSCVEKFEKLH